MRVALGPLTMSPIHEFRLPLAGVAAGLALLAFVREPAAARASTPALSESAGRTGSLAGVVLDAHGDPVPGALVLVVDAQGRAVAESQTALDADDPAHALGEFRIANLPAGEYGVRAVVPDSDSVARVSRIPVRAWEDTHVSIRVDLGY